MLGALVPAKLLADVRGSTMVEFALVGGAFVVMLLGVLDLAMMYLVNGGLAFALEETARQSMVGNSALRDSREAFVAAVCGQVALIPACENQLAIDLRSFDPRTVIELAMPLGDDGRIDAAALQFQPGGPETFVLARAAITYQFITPFLGQIFDNTEQGRTLLMATTAYRNEPFQRALAPSAYS